LLCCVLCCVLCLAATARADIPPPNSADCATKAVGDRCKKDDGTMGTCESSTCSRNDYSQGIPPKSVSYECKKCGDGAAPVAVAPVADAGVAPGKKSGCAAAPGLALLALGAWLGVRRRARGA
jgi:hypothetical protein